VKYLSVSGTVPSLLDRSRPPATISSISIGWVAPDRHSTKTSGGTGVDPKKSVISRSTSATPRRRLQECLELDHVRLVQAEEPQGLAQPLQGQPRRAGQLGVRIGLSGDVDPHPRRQDGERRPGPRRRAGGRDLVRDGDRVQGEQGVGWARVPTTTPNAGRARSPRRRASAVRKTGIASSLAA